MNGVLLILAFLPQPCDFGSSYVTCLIQQKIRRNNPSRDYPCACTPFGLVTCNEIYREKSTPHRSLWSRANVETHGTNLGRQPGAWNPTDPSCIAANPQLHD